MTKEQAHELMDEALDKLAEQFDCVQICATEHLGKEGTDVFFRGSGNFFARRAICETFSRRDHAAEAAQLIAQEIQETED